MQLVTSKFQKINSFIISVFPLGFLIIDTISGFLMLEGYLNVSVSIFYKSIFILLCVFYLFTSSSANKTNKILVLGMLVYICVRSLILVFMGRSEHVLISSLELFKLFSTFILFYSLITLPGYTYLKLRKFFFVTLVVVLFNVLLSLLGVAYNSYGDYGAKGFLFGGNALSGVIVIIAIHYLVKFYNYNTNKFLFCTIFFILLSLIIGTKSSILGVILGSLLVVLFKGRLKDYLILFFLLLLFIASYSIGIDYIESTAMFSRLSYFYQSGGLEQLIFSGRLDFLSNVWKVFIEQDAITLILGLDPSLLFDLNQQISEMDITDIILSFGFLTLFVYIFLITLTLLYILKSSPESIMHASIITSILLIAIGSIAGHVLFNGVVTPYWAILLSLPVLEKKYKQTN
jgi:hypothetical protein